MLTLVNEYTSDLFGLFYPSICLACSKKLLKGEEIICFRCISEMPQTGYWKDSNNKLMNRFTGRVELQSAVAFFHFKKEGIVQHLLHQLKYRKRKDVGEYLGKMFGAKLKEESDVLQHIDLIVPVPLHWKKLKTRGYNQCDPFAQGLSDTTQIPWSSTALVRQHENISQTKKKRFDRWGNVAEIFAVSDEKQLTGKHILLVDDVVTTGATSEACLQTILKVPETKVSFAAIAAASR